jgi:hypothetical protein
VQRSALGIAPRSATSRALAATIVELCNAETLPAPGDATTLLDPEDERGVAVLAHVRRLAGRNLWVWYRDAGNALEMLRITGEPPEPIRR